jgi:hypothetical protein
MKNKSSWKNTIVTILSFFVSLAALFFANRANNIAKSTVNPYIKIEYLTINDIQDFKSLWGLNNNISIRNHEEFGFEKIIWRIVSENVIFMNEEKLLKKELVINGMNINTPFDSILNRLKFEAIHIKNVSPLLAKDVKIRLTEKWDFEVVNEYKMDVAMQNESIILLCKIFFINNGDTITIGPESTLESIKYTGYSKKLERKNRERFEGNHIIKSVNGGRLIAQCPFVYTQFFRRRSETVPLTG